MDHEFIDTFGKLQLALFRDLGGYSYHNHLKLKKGKSYVSLEEFNSITEDMLSHVVVESLTIIKHDFLVVGIKGRNHFGEDL